MLNIGEIRSNHLPFGKKVVEISPRGIKDLILLIGRGTINNCDALVIYLCGGWNRRKLALH